MNVNVDGAHGEFFNLDYKIAQEVWPNSISTAHGKSSCGGDVSLSKDANLCGKVMQGKYHRQRPNSTRCGDKRANALGLIDLKMPE
jgi:hypothetical protein